MTLHSIQIGIAKFSTILWAYGAMFSTNNDVKVVCMIALFFALLVVILDPKPNDR